MLPNSPIKPNKSVGAANKSNILINLPDIRQISKQSLRTRRSKLSYIESVESIFDRTKQDGSKSLLSDKSKLRALLEKMNREGLQVIEAKKAKGNSAKVSEQCQLIDKQIQNGKRVMLLMEEEKRKLQEKFQRIVYPQHLQEILHKIEEITKQIEQIRANNAQMRSFISKASFKIVKQEGQGFDYRQEYLQADKHQVEQKLLKLKDENNRVVDETRKMQQQTKEVQAKILACEQEYKKITVLSFSQTSNRSNQATLMQRRSQLESMRRKMEAHNQILQYKHGRLNKQLELCNSHAAELTQREDALSETIRKSREEMLRLQVEGKQKSSVKEQ